MSFINRVHAESGIPLASSSSSSFFFFFIFLAIFTCNVMQSLKMACQSHPNIAVEKPRLWPIIRRSTLNRLLLLRMVFALSLVSSIN